MGVKNGQTDVTRNFVLRDSTTHEPATSLTITNISIRYAKDRMAMTEAVSLSSLAAADSAHTDNAGFHVGEGVYRIDFPDAAFNGGIGTKVLLIVKCAGVDTTFEEIELSPPVDVVSVSGGVTAADNLESACNNYSATRGLAGTALPAAAADGAGGLPISDAGGLDMDTKLANTNQVTAARMGALTDLIDGGRLDMLIDAIKTKTDFLPSITPGQANGLFIAGTNAAVTITSNSGHALTLSATGGTGSGMNVTAAGSMIPAIYIAGGLGGTGISGNITGNITGNVSGSVGSVSGAVGSVTGNVGGNVAGSVGSVTGNVSGSVNSVVTAVTATGVSDIKAVTDKLDTMVEVVP